MSESSESEGRRRAREEFTAPGPLPPGADLADAEARLLDTLERELGVPLAPKAAPGTPGSPAAPTAPRPSRGPRPRLRPLLSLAAVILAAAGLLWSQDALRRKREGELLRGSPPAETKAGWAARPVATPLGGGRLRLAWAPLPGATRYGVTFLGEDLRELARADDLPRTSLELDRGALPEGLTPGRTVLWRVSAYAGADELARSGTLPLTLP